MKKFSLFGCLLFLIACGNAQTEEEEIITYFNSIATGLRNQLPGISREKAYELVKEKLKTDKQLKKVVQMEQEVGGFITNISDLRRQFFIACGDSTGKGLPSRRKQDIAITNAFFSKEPAIHLLSWLTNAKKNLAENTSAPVLQQDIKYLGIWSMDPYTDEEWRKKYFQDVPPIGAVMLLNAFEEKVKDIEKSILAAYLN